MENLDATIVQFDSDLRVGGDQAEGFPTARPGTQVVAVLRLRSRRRTRRGDYYLGSSLVFSTAFAAIADKRIDTSAMNQPERMAAGVKIALDELNEVNFRIHNVLYGIIKPLLEQAVGGSLDSLDRTDIQVVGAPRPTMVALPMFVDIGQPDKMP
jgi:hypothetical protein